MDSNQQEKNITDLPSKLPVKLSKRAHSNIHLVSSTPMNPSKKAKFFDETNQLGSPIRSGSTTDVNSNSPDTNIKIIGNKLITKPTMINNEEQAAGASPFPYYTKLSVKKMTICASEDDTDDNLFVSPDKIVKPKKQSLDNMVDESNSSSEHEYQSLIIKKTKTKAIVEPLRNDTSDDEFDYVKTNKNVVKPNKPSKQNDENKENVEIQTKKKPTTEKSTNTTVKVDNLTNSPKQKKSKKVEKSTKTVNESENIDIDKKSTTIAKQKHTNDNTKLQATQRKMTESVRKSTRAAKTAAPFWIWPHNSTIAQNDTQIIKRTKSAEVNNTIVSVKESNRPKTVPETAKKGGRNMRNTLVEVSKRTNKKETVAEKTTVNNKSPPGKRKIPPKTNEDPKLKSNDNENDIEIASVQKVQTRKKVNNKKDEHPDTTKILNKPKMKVQELLNNDESDSGKEPEPKNQTKKKTNENIKTISDNNNEKDSGIKKKMNDKNDEIPAPAKTLNRSKSKLNEIDKNNETITKSKNQSKNELPDITKTLNKSKTKVNEVTDKREQNNETLTKSKSPTKKKENDKNTTVTDELGDTTKTLNKSYKKRNVLKSKDNDDNIEFVPIEQNNRTRLNAKEVLDRENEEKKLQKSTATSSNYNLKDIVSQSALDDDVFETENNYENVSRASRKDTTVKSKNTTTRYNSPDRIAQTVQAVSPPRSSKRIKAKNIDSYKETNKITYSSALLNNPNNKPSTSAMNTTKNTTVKKPFIPELENDFQSDVSLSAMSKESEPLVSTVRPTKIRGRPVVKTPRYVRKSAHKHIRPSSTTKLKNKQVNFNVNRNNSEIENTFDSDSLSMLENPPKMYRRSSRKLFNTSRSRFRRNSFHRSGTADLHKRNTRRYNKYVNNESTIEETDSLSSEEFYMPENKKRKYEMRDRKRPNSVLHFKEKALTAKVPNVARGLTKVKHNEQPVMMELFGHFPSTLSKVNDTSVLRGTCFMNDIAASGIMEIKLGKVKSCKGSENHTYFIVLDGMAEIGIADSTKILRIGDCCLVPKHTFYYIMNASNEINLLVNFLKITT